MRTWLRRVRGAVKMGLTWGLAWFAAGMVLLLIVGPDAADVPFPLGFGFLGFLAGMSFSAVVVSLGGRRRFDQMSLPRFAGWGGIGGGVFAVFFVFAVAAYGEGAAFIRNLVFLAPLFAALGAGSAAALLVLARRAESRELPDAGPGVAELGLLEDKAREVPAGRG